MQNSLALIATEILFLILSGFTQTGLRKDCSVKREIAPEKTKSSRQTLHEVS
jgi:hypothetical protein